MTALCEVCGRDDCGTLEASYPAEDLADCLQVALTRALAERDEARRALDAIWGYQNAMQADLKARGEVSTVTMHMLLEAARLRELAGARAPEQAPTEEES